MGKIELNAELSGNLAFILFIPNLFLFHDLHTAKETSLFMLDKHNLTELSFT
jgi:hypothetical protein